MGARGKPDSMGMEQKTLGTGAIPLRKGARACPRAPAEPLVERARLSNLELAPDDQLILITAPAGYGKTALLYQWWLRASARNEITAWIEVNEAHADPQVFSSHLKAALIAACKEDLPEAFDPCPDDAGLGLLLERAIGARSQDALIFLDDAQLINGTPAAALLCALIKAAPPRAHFIVASRGRLEIGVGKLRAQGRVREIDVGELRFDEAETEALLDRLRVGDPETRAKIKQACEGWPAGLLLAARAADAQSRGASRPAPLSGELRPLAEYFSEEAFEREPADVQEFLLQTSILERLSAELCEAVTGKSDSFALLEHCERRGLFLFSLDESRQWLRYHPLFAGFLRRRLKERRVESAETLHRRASDWLVKAGQYVEAIDHALRGGDPRRAGEILNEHCTDSYGENLDQALLGLASRLPADVQELYPRITLAVVWPLLFAWRFDQAQKLLSTCRRKLDEIRSSGQIAGDEMEELEHLFLHREMMLSLYHDDMRLVEDHGERLAREYDGARPLVKASIYVSLIQARCEEYRLREVERLQLSARQFLAQTGHPLAMIPIESVVGRARLLAGNASESTAPLAREVERAAHHPGGEILGSMAAITLAEIFYEQDRLEEASRLLDSHLRPNPEFGFVEGWIGGHITAARLLQIKGELDCAHDELMRAAVAGTGGGFERIQLFFGVERLRLLLRRGDIARAAALARELNLAGERPPMPVGRVTLRDEMRARGWAQFAAYQGRHAEALKVARQWRTFAANALAMRSAIHWDIAIASLLLQEGEERAAMRNLRQAVMAAAPGGYIRAFLDEAPSIGHVLLAHPEIAAGQEARSAAFGRALIAALERELGQRAGGRHFVEAPAGGPLRGALSHREVEMLRMVAGGLKNREIAARLSMTEGSVKWQLHQAYAKLGTDRRIHAIARARQLGFLMPN
jgi:LuxR family maltose regulon positive regulatory protein